MQKFKKWRNSSWSISPYNIFCLITVSFHILLFVKKLPPFLVCFCSPKYVQYSPPWNHLWGTERVPRLPKSYISTVIKHPVCLGRKCVWEMGARSLALTVPNGLVESSVLHPPWHTNEAPYGSPMAWELPAGGSVTDWWRKRMEARRDRENNQCLKLCEATEKPTAVSPQT